MGHYFLHDPGRVGDAREIDYTEGGRRFTFATHGGLFSYKAVDGASCLLLGQLPPLPGRVLDLGCGYGFIGIVLAARGSDVTMSDSNPAAVACARKNCESNNVDARVALSDRFDAIDGVFDAIVTNPPVHAGKETVFRMYEEARAFLTAGGSLFTVIQKKHGAESHAAKIKDMYRECLILYKRKGYYILQGKK